MKVLSNCLRVLLLSGLVLAVIACNAQTNDVGARTPAPAPEPLSPMTEAARPQLQGTATVVLELKGESITLELNGDQAPMTAGNFVDLVQRGVYDGTLFHRVVREPEPFVVQGGDPQSKDPNVPENLLGQGGFVDPESGQERNIPLEILPEGASEPVYGQTLSPGMRPQLVHRRGAVAMARSQALNSASSQFYITLANVEFLDGNYAVFGYVTDGMEVVDQIQQGDRLDRATVTEGIENLSDS
ncbi:peptidylprolyl isomerase [Synechococcales cyanobacterium C]|uniref:Peptidyl-prolyl cis-trans isomerase n=1 Tax=Petrachloros mirabilis ULC683 TaxID=2781853 RepID=A0A8K1ZWN4_9CYAN|nr:peptidylprolyl isomerase [Petrachloros mirabilis]NCJ06615.1 peptidylprolyl isomerase [Petrachloros mirabilis ULC683]